MLGLPAPPGEGYRIGNQVKFRSRCMGIYEVYELLLVTNTSHAVLFHEQRSAATYFPSLCGT